MAGNNALNLNQQGVTYFNGTSAFSGLDGGTAGNVLTSNGTGVAPSFATLPPLGSLVLLETIADFNLPFFSFTNTSATYATYFFDLGFSTSDSAAFLQMLVSTDGGSTYLNSGYLGGTNIFPVTSATGSNVNNAAYFQLSGPISNARSYSSSMYCWNIRLSTNMQMAANGFYFDSASGDRSMTFSGGEQAIGVNAFQFILSTGLFANVSCSMYGLAQ